MTIGSATNNPAPGAAAALISLTRGTEATRSEATDGEFTLITVTVPSEDAWFLIRTHNKDVGRMIADSLALLPEGQTTIPDITTGNSEGQPGLSAAPGPSEVTMRLEQAGLSAAIRYETGASSTTWSALTLSVQPGNVVDVGATVTATYSDSSKKP